MTDPDPASSRPDPTAPRPDPNAPQPGVTQHRGRPRIWRGEELTEPMPLSASLRRTPYRNPRRMEAPAEEQTVRTALELAVRAGELMLRCGGSARDVESSVVAVATSAGLERLEVDITNQSLLVQCISPSGELHTLLRVVRSTSRDFARLAALHEFVEELVAGRIDLRQATARLRQIRRHPRFWPRWAITFSYGVLAGSVALQLGASVPAVGLALLSAMLVDRVGRVLASRGLPSFYLSAVGGAIATAVAWGAFVLGRSGALDVTRAGSAYIVAGGIVVLLPGRAMVSSVEDAITGYPVTGAGRLFTVGLTAAGIITGVAAALSVTVRLDQAFGLGASLPKISVEGAGVALPVLVVAGAVGAVASAIAQRTRRKLLVPTAVLGGLGTLVTGLVHQTFGLGQLTGLTIACVLVGFGGRLVALRMGAPGLVLVAPAVGPLLPGLTIFRGMSLLVSGSVIGQGGASTAAGLTILLGAGAAALAIATGVVLGDLMASPFDRQIVRQRRARLR